MEVLEFDRLLELGVGEFWQLNRVPCGWIPFYDEEFAVFSSELQRLESDQLVLLLGFSWRGSDLVRLQVLGACGQGWIHVTSLNRGFVEVPLDR